MLMGGIPSKHTDPHFIRKHHIMNHTHLAARRFFMGRPLQDNASMRAATDSSYYREARGVMFRKLLDGRGANLNYDLLVASTEGYSGADVTQVMRSYAHYPFHDQIGIL